MRTSLAGVCLSLVTVLAGQTLAADVRCIGTETVTARKSVEQCRADARDDAIAPHDGARAFVVIKPEAFIVGEIPARATSWTAVQKQAAVSVTVAITAAKPVDPSCTLSLDPVIDDAEAADRAPKWSIDLPPPAGGERRLMLPAGRYTIAADCKGFVPAETTLTAGGKAGPARVALALAAVPRVTGRVVTPEPAVAQIHDPEGRLLGQTEPDGAFVLSILPKEWPASLAVSSPGLGTALVSLPLKAIPLDLPDIELRKAGQVSIAAAPEILRQIESVDVFDMRNRFNKKLYRKVRGETLRAKNNVIPDLQPGPYLVVLAGAQPLERFGQQVDVVVGETAIVQADWTPQEVEIRTFLGDERLGNAELDFRNVKYHWNGTVRTAADGARTVRLWQPGEFGCMLKADGDVRYWEVLELQSTRVDIRVPNRTVEISVVDAATDTPLSDVRVSLEEGGGITQLTSGTDGVARITGVTPGRYRVSGGGTQGLSRRTVGFEVTEQMSHRQVRLELRRQPELELELVTALGAPASGATVIDVALNTITRVAEADQAGRVRLSRDAPPSRAIIVLTPDGGLYAQPLATSTEQSTVRVVIPPLTSTISVHLESSGDQKPIPGVALAMRFNGVLIPDEAASFIGNKTGLMLRSGPDGRIRLPRVAPGTYEFWPVRSRSDIQAFMTGQLGAAPVVVVAKPGENVAKLTFARVEPRETP